MSWSLPYGPANKHKLENRHLRVSRSDLYVEKNIMLNNLHLETHIMTHSCAKERTTSNYLLQRY